MTLKELFPAYPLVLYSPPNSKIKFGTRKLYADLPWQAYQFLQAAMSKAIESGLTKEEVREEWRKFLQDNRDSLTFRGKPFVQISLKSLPFSKKDHLVLNVKWDLFIEYLEEKAVRFLSKTMERGENIGEVYREIWNNYFLSIGGFPIPPVPSYSPFSLETFRKLLKRTGDYSYIKNLLDQFEEMMRKVGEAMKDEIPPIQLYTTNLRMDIKHLRASIDIVDIPAAYLLLRNLLENFIKLFVYLKVGSSVNPNVALFSMFFYEYEMSGKKYRMNSLSKFEREWVGKFSEIYSTIPHVDLIEKFKEKCMPRLWIDRRFLEEFSKSYNLEEAKLVEIYSACSFVVHNQPPLPFFSLLEVKFFKRFLERYLYSIRLMVEKLTGNKIEIEKVHSPPLLGKEERASLRKCLEVTYSLDVKHGEEIREIIKKLLKILREGKKAGGSNRASVDPLTLMSVFGTLSPSFIHLRNFSFIEEDLEDVIKKLEPLTPNKHLRHKVQETLNLLQEVLTPYLENYEIFSSLNSEQKRKVSFYLLMLYLPKIVEDSLRS